MYVHYSLFIIHLSFSRFTAMSVKYLKKRQLWTYGYRCYCASDFQV